LMNNKETATLHQNFKDDLKEIIVEMLKIFQFNVEISKTICGRSGITHEVDIVAEKRDRPQTRFLIKCKSYMEEATLRLDEVLCFWSQILDVSADRGVIVTSCRVSESAAKFAEYRGISIVTAKNLVELRHKILKSELFVPKMVR